MYNDLIKIAINLINLKEKLFLFKQKRLQI
jgi:hypothetical protein